MIKNFDASPDCEERNEFDEFDENVNSLRGAKVDACSSSHYWAACTDHCEACSAGNLVIFEHRSFFSVWSPFPGKQSQKSRLNNTSSVKYPKFACRSKLPIFTVDMRGSASYDLRIIREMLRFDVSVKETLRLNLPECLEVPNCLEIFGFWFMLRGRFEWSSNGAFWSPQSPYWGRRHKRGIATTAVANRVQRLVLRCQVALQRQAAVPEPRLGQVVVTRLSTDHPVTDRSAMHLLATPVAAAAPPWSNRRSWNQS